MEFINKQIRGMCVPSIVKNLQNVFAAGIMEDNPLSEELLKLPSQFSPEIWGTVQAVATTVMQPVAWGVLMYVMSFELFSWVKEQNNMHTSADVLQKFVWFVIKLYIGVLLVTKSSDIIIGIFDLGTYITNKSMAVIGMSGAGSEIMVSLDAFEAELWQMGGGEVFGLFIFSWLALLVVKGLSLIMYGTVLSRMIEIYLYCAVGGIPCSTLLNPTVSGIGMNYIKNLLALAFQGLFMLLSLSMYGSLVITVGIDSSNPLAAMGNLLLISAIMAFTLIKSKALAKSIFAAQ